MAPKRPRRRSTSSNNQGAKRLQLARTPRPILNAWKIVIDAKKGKCVQATRDIKLGERIMVESPLLTLAGIPPDVRDDRQWLVPEKLANGSGTVKLAVDRLTDAEQRRFRRLHCPDAKNRKGYPADDPKCDALDMLTIALNAFSHVEDINAIPYTVTRVFENLSRINQSCRPNAMVEWNPTIGKGTIHALMEIKRGTEITIDYVNNAQVVLESPKARCKLLQAQYRFVCTCEACGPADAVADKLHAVKAKVLRDREDDKSELHRDLRLRLRARDLLEEIDWDMSSDIDLPQNAEAFYNLEQVIADQVELTSEYLIIVKLLGLEDYKMAHAYAARVALLEICAKMEQLKIDRGEPDDRRNSPPLAFWEMALSEMNSQYILQLRCAGEDHPTTQALLAKLRQMNDLCLNLRMRGREGTL